MKIKKLAHWEDLPENFTGIVEYPSGNKHWFKDGIRHFDNGPAVEWSDGSKFWYKDDKRHREDGPAVEFINGDKSWWIEDKKYSQINLKDYIVLDSYQGKYNLIWYKLLAEDGVFEYPDVPGLIIK